MNLSASEIGDLVRAARLDVHMSIEQLADAVGASYGTIQGLESGNRQRIDIMLLFKIGDVTGTEIIGGNHETEGR